jgi:hypothetical protein
MKRMLNKAQTLFYNRSRQTSERSQTMQAFSMEKSILKAGDQVNELFNFIKDNAKMSEAYEMERSIFLLVMKIGLTGMQTYFAEKGTGDAGSELKTEDGKVFRKEKALRERDYFSVFGKFRICRTCYRLKGEKGLMPLDAEANLPASCYSYLLQEWMNILSIGNSYEESSALSERLLGVKVYGNRFEAVSGAGGMSYDQFYSDKDMPSALEEGEINVVSFDGKGVPVIKSEACKLSGRLGKGEKHQKKKEAIVGVSYTTDRKERNAEEVAGNLVYPEKRRKSEKEVKAKNTRRMASLEREDEEVVREIIGYSQKRKPESEEPSVVVMDGALKLWLLIEKVLKGVRYVGILDIIHVTEYLWKVGNGLYGECTSEGKKWVYDNLVMILKGRVVWVIGGLKRILRENKLKASQRQVILVAIRYFENHQKWMRYDEYLKAGYPISSGVVESACGHTVKNRMEGCGRRWSVEGAESILLLRSLYSSGDWDDYWNFHMRLEKSFYYHNVLKALGINNDYNELGCREDHKLISPNLRVAA